MPIKLAIGHYPEPLQSGSSLHTVLLWDLFSYHPFQLYLISHVTTCSISLLLYAWS
jgi:hypothetical protein